MAQHVRLGREGQPLLQGLLFAPGDGDGEAAGVCVVVTHPHPKLGGDMYNPVVRALARGLAARGAKVLCFNFRGVGESQGRSSWTGSPEQEDVRAAIEFARAQPEVERVILVGYSFGAAVGCKHNDLLDGYVAVSYPFGRAASCVLGRHFKAADSPLPKLFVIGDQDQFAAHASLRAFVDGLQQPADFVLVPGADHIWDAPEEDLVPVVADFVAKHARRPS